MHATTERKTVAPSLADLVSRRIDTTYGGNQTAFAEVVGLSPQYVSRLRRGIIGLPAQDKRGPLARELGITPVELLVLAGELTAEEAALGGAPVGVGRDTMELVQALSELTPEQVKALRLSVEAFRAFNARRRTEGEPAPARR